MPLKMDTTLHLQCPWAGHTLHYGHCDKGLREKMFLVNCQFPEYNSLLKSLKKLKTLRNVIC